MAEQVYHVGRVDILVALVLCTHWLEAVYVDSRVVLGRRVLSHFQVRVWHVLIQGALFYFGCLIDHILIQIHQILRDVLAVLEVLLVNLVIILWCLECRLLL